MASLALVILLFCAAANLCIAQTSKEADAVPNNNKWDGRDLSFPDCGQPYESNQSPWLAKIRINAPQTRDSKNHCYGVVISNISILASAHCFDAAKELHQIQVTLPPNFANANKISPSRYSVHQNYDRINGLKNNIAVLTFDHDLLSSHVWPICVWKQAIEQTGQLISPDSFGPANVMGKISLPGRKISIATDTFNVLQPAECMQRTLKTNEHFFDFGRICVTNFQKAMKCLEGRDGALLQFEIDGRWFLRGLLDKRILTSKYTCDTAVFSFTDVAKHREFIYANARTLFRDRIGDFQDVPAKSLFSYQGCGETVAMTASNYLVANGVPTKIIEYPWQIAMYSLPKLDEKKGPRRMEFICGGFLISKRYALTAAHCMTDFLDLYRTTYTIRPEADFRIVLGVSYKIMYETMVMPSEIYKVEKFIPNPYFNANNDAFDIGLLKLTQDVQFTRKVSPLCLWTDSGDREKILGRYAKVAGLGLMKDHKEASQLQMTEIPILGSENCSQIATNTELHMICAGYTNGTAVCNGDSGGPLLLMENGRWYARGLVSHGKRFNETEIKCDYNYTSLFTDITLHRKWVEDNSDVSFEYSDKPFVKSNFNQPSCGKAVFTGESIFLSSATGNKRAKTSASEFPWIASLVYVDHSGGDEIFKFKCGATLISSKHVLTAAHCVLSNTPAGRIELGINEFVVKLGKTYHPDDNSSDSKWRNIQTRLISKIVAHETFKFSTKSAPNDIALIELSEEVEFTATVMPICLWTGSTERIEIMGRDAVFIGWGFVDDFQLPEQLNKLTLSILPNNECRDILDGQDEHDFPMICVGNTNGYNPCKGDSGSPIMLKEHGRYYARGIVSFGKRNPYDHSICDPLYPSFAVDIALHKAWIEKNSDITFE